MSHKHFNMGNVWGTLSSLTWKKIDGKPRYLLLKIKCDSAVYGNVTVFGKLWGKPEELTALSGHHKQNPGTLYRFKGFFNQYEKNDKLYSGFSFYDWSRAKEGAEGRAAFILTGEVADVDGDCLHLHLSRNEGTQEEDFQIWELESQSFSGVQEGDTVKLKGVLAAEEDYYGESANDVKPYAVEVKVLGEKKSDV